MSELEPDRTSLESKCCEMFDRRGGLVVSFVICEELGAAGGSILDISPVRNGR